jgi:hypothetical protein
MVGALELAARPGFYSVALLDSTLIASVALVLIRFEREKRPAR